MPVPMSKRTKTLFGASLAATILAAVLWIATGVTYVFDVRDAASAADSASVVQHKSTGALVPAPARERVQKALFHPDSVRETGQFIVAHARPCRDGMTDVTGYPQVIRTIAEKAGVSVCGTLWEGALSNAMTHYGAGDMIACYFKQTSCPVADSLYLGLFQTASFARTMTTGTEQTGTGYSRAQILTTCGAAPCWTTTNATGSANTAATGNKTWTAGSDWPATVGLGIFDAGTGMGIVAYSAFARDLASSDTLTVSYTLTLQSTAD